MNRNEGEEFGGNTIEEDEILAIPKKRTRRVSFADTTVIRFFDRDEDVNASSDSKPKTITSEFAQNDGEILGFPPKFEGSNGLRKIAMGDDDEKEEDDVDDETDGGDRELFVRNMDSSSPGSAASLTSNDEDNFFGPVSTDFIREGLSSESRECHDHHDITLDSTAFSLHFHSLVSSEETSGNCGPCLKTPTAVRLSFDEKTPNGDSMPTNPGSLMALTRIKRTFAHGSVSDKHSCGKDSNDMSLILEKKDKFDYYGTLSPTLNAILAEGTQKTKQVSVSNKFNTSESLESSRNDYSQKKEFSRNDTENLKDENDGKIPPESETHAEVHSIGEESALHTTPREEHSSTKPSRERHSSADIFMQHLDQSSKKTKGDMLFDMHNLSNTHILEHSRFQRSFYDSHNDQNLSSPSDAIAKPTAVAHFTPDSRKHVHCLSQNPSHHLDSPHAGSISTLRARRQQLFHGNGNNEGEPNVDKRDDLLRSFSEVRMHVPHEMASHRTPVASEYMDNIPYNLKASGGIRPCISVTTKEFDSQIGVEQNQRTGRLTLTKSPCQPVSLAFGKLISGNTLDSTLCVSEDDPQLQKRSIDSLTHMSTGLDSHDNSSEKVVNNLLATKLNEETSGNTLGSWFKSSDFDSSNLKEDAECSIVEVTKMNYLTCNSPNFSSVKRLDRRLLALEDSFGMSGTTSEPYEHLIKLVDASFLGDQGKVETETNLSHEKLSHVRMKQQSKDSLLQSSYTETPRLQGNGDLPHNLSGPSFKESDKRSTNDAARRPPFKTFNGKTNSSLLLNKTRDVTTKLFGPNESEQLEDFDEGIKNEDILSCHLDKESRHTIDQRLALTSAHFPCTKDVDQLTENCGHQYLQEEDFSCKLDGTSVNAPEISEFSITQTKDSIANDSVTRKRKCEVFPDMKEDHIDLPNVTRKNPKVVLAMIEISTQDTSLGNNIKDFASIYSNVGGWTSLLLLNELKKWELDTVEDIMNQLKKARKYKKLHKDFQSQELLDHTGQLRRESQARGFQIALECERAKLYLKYLKRKKLQEQQEQLKSKIQECHKLKFDLASHSCFCASKGIQHNGISNRHRFADSAPLTKELKELDKKLSDISRSFGASCKIKEDLRYDDLIISINKCVVSLNRCQHLCEDLQLWEISEIEKKKGQYSIVLNYGNLLSQRFIVNVGLVSNGNGYYVVDETNVNKRFPYIGSCTAFKFIFGKVNYQITSAKTFWQEIQATSFTFSNLLDVVEEVHWAVLENSTLVSASFHSLCGTDLDLKLNFVHFVTGRRVSLTLDMSHLKCGGYPSEIIPSHQNVEEAMFRENGPLPLSVDISNAIKRLHVGPSRIKRLCSCINDIVQRRQS